MIIGVITDNDIGELRKLLNEIGIRFSKKAGDKNACWDLVCCKIINNGRIIPSFYVS